MSDIIAAVVTGLHSGRFIEETLEALCVAVGAASAWSTLELSGDGPMHRSRTTSFQGVSPAVLAQHVTEVLGQVEGGLRAVAGSVPYASSGSFIAVPLWSGPGSSRSGRKLLGAMYMEFPGTQGSSPATVEFVEAVGLLLGGVIAQQSLIDSTREDLRVERARDTHEHYLELDELLAPESMASIREEALSAIRGRASVMILGESGTGKTQLATSFARASAQDPIVRATLGLSDDLNTITSELFGHERGSFSGAVSKRKGLVEYADGGTLILDEVLNLQPHAQQLLLDFTQFGHYRPLGHQGREPKKADVRLISVTNGDMNAAIADKRFRQDLYYRLAIVPLILPPLRDRRQDIPKIAVRYLNRTDAHGEWELDAGAVDALTAPQLGWDGNIRELEAVMERARNRARASGSDETVIERRHLALLEHEPSVPPEASPDEPSVRAGSPKEAIVEKWGQLRHDKRGLDLVERQLIEETLELTGGIVSRAARILAVPRTGLISRMVTLDVDPEKFKD
ncbi:MAG: sigma 54-interacting transcriptional regulator [Myxococcota bacterium]